MFRHLLVVLSMLCVSAVSCSAKPDSWVEVRSAHFVVVSNANEKQARHVADQFEKMRVVFHKAFPNARVDAASPIVVMAVKNQKDFATLEPEQYLAKGQLKLAGLFLMAYDKNYVLLRLDSEGEHPFSTVYHEYTHFMMSRAQAWLPLWLNEGLAEFYENTEINDKDVALGQPSIGNLTLLRENKLLPLPTLFTVDYKSPYYHEEDKGSIFYAESWALMHYLQMKDRQENTHRLFEYTKLVSQEIDPVTAGTKAFGDLGQLQKELQRYVNQGSFMYMQVKGATDIDESSFKSRALTTAQANAIRADIMVCNKREKDAKALIDAVLSEDQDNVGAYETLGLLAFESNNFGEAERWYSKAVQLDSQSYLAHYYYSLAAMREGVREERAQQIETSLRTAVKLNPSFAPALNQLAVFLAQRRKNLDEAYALSQSAVQSDPANVVLRMNWAYVLSQGDRAKDAISVMQQALKLAKDPEQVAAIQRQLESFQQYEAAREKQAREYEEYKKRSAAEKLVAEQIPEGTKDPSEEEDKANGPRKTVMGTLSDVHCSDPATMKIKVNGKSSSIALRSLNYYKVAYSALDFTPSGELNPCKDLEGVKAKVVYVESPMGGTDGRLISIEMRK